MSVDGQGHRRSERDLRLDFFRGIGMCIILIAHIPGNAWINWIPARFGFSDATEIFVFCSGMASAHAFARVFDRHGWTVGTLRIGLRVWQIWWAQIGVFIAVLALMVAADRLFATDAYTRLLQLQRFLADPGSGILGLMSLTYVPNYFDILPMYLVILVLIPVMLGLERLHGRGAALAAMVLLWCLAQTRLTALPADPWMTRQWFFDPFGWQLVFFTGFALVRGWLPAPPRSTALALAAVVVIALAVPFSWLPLVRALPVLESVHDLILPLTGKTRFGLLRFVHFLALAYLAWWLVGPAGSRLGGPLVRRCVLIGRQSLAVFLAGLVTAQVLGIVLHRSGGGPVVVPLLNLGGILVLLVTARIVDWYKAQPWTRPATRPAEAPPPLARPVGLS
ncbi:OpgC family protein [Geminicoccus harenae]|uniref:OpgC family protein n=1 Tax=Geminicoccus harenae TaxID=2498453 RepID=UPI001CC31E84|nr:OpgC domain-containing protein [Geminicoccus harenae]